MAIGMMWFTYLQTTAYNEHEIEQTRSQMMEMKKAELKNYVQMARSAVEPLLAQNAPLEEALPILKQLELSLIHI